MLWILLKVKMKGCGSLRAPSRKACSSGSNLPLFLSSFHAILTSGSDGVFEDTEFKLGGDLATCWTTKLRLYRNYSIKLMLAWETCCRSDLPPSPISPDSCVGWKTNLHSSRIWYALHLSRNCHVGRSSGRARLRFGFRTSAVRLRRVGSDHPTQMP